MLVYKCFDRVRNYLSSLGHNNRPEDRELMENLTALAAGNGSFDLTQLDFEALKQLDVRTVDPDILVDIRTLEIDKILPREQRIEHYLQTL